MSRVLPYEKRYVICPAVSISLPCVVLGTRTPRSGSQLASLVAHVLDMFHVFRAIRYTAGFLKERDSQKGGTPQARGAASKKRKAPKQQ